MLRSRFWGGFITICMSLMLAAAIAPLAWADDSTLTQDDGIGDTEAPLLTELGFSPSGAMEDINNVTSSGITPYGDNAFTLAGFDELFLQSTYFDGGSRDIWHNNAYVWDTLANPSSVNGNPANNGLNIGSTAQDWSAGNNATTDVAQQYSYCSSAALDADGDGRNNFVAQVYGTDMSNGTFIGLRLINAETGTVSPSITIVQTHSWVQQAQVGALLSLATGDYDGDGIDEIAVYDPSGPRVDFYKPAIADDGSLSLSKIDGRSLDIQGITGMDFGKATGVCSGALSSDNFDELNELACVDLCTVSQPSETADDLALAVSYSREAHDRKWGTDISKDSVGSHVVTVTDPLTDGSQTQNTAMQWTWSSYGSTSSGAGNNAETMMFAGLGSGDIDNDGIDELVVGGYRLEDADLTDDDNTDISNDEFLITYFDYALTDPATEAGSYTLAQKGQSISIDSDDYNNDTDLDDGFHSTGGSDVDDLYSPLSTTCFAAQGSSYADSVCLGGIVCRLGSQTAYGYGNYVMLSNNGRGSNYPKYSGSPSDKLNGILQTQFGTTGFVAQYALQLKALDEKAFSESNNRLILDATAGNFDNNIDGREQLVFNYLVKQDEDKQFSTFVGIMNQNVSGDLPLKNFGSGSTRRIGDSSAKTDNVVMTCRQFADEDFPAMMTIAAVDIDHDSIIVRPTDKNPDFYFSNPKVIAILEGDPVYNDIIDEYENTEGGTSFTKSSGSGTTTTQDVSLTAGLITGTTVGLDLIVTNVEMELEQTLSASAGYAYEKETSTTSSLSFTTHQQDQVGLVMTPYVRYYYDVWAENTDENGQGTGVWGWQEMTVDVPRTPQTTIILVDTYDRVAQEYNDALDSANQNKAWTTIRGNIITNEVGDPASYPTDLPAETEYVKWQNIKDVSGSLGEGDFIGVGEGAGEVGRTLSYETATSNGITWGTSIERENKITVRNAATVGYKWSIDYSGSYSWNSTKGVEYGWTVSSVPSEYFADYNFRWLPIIGTAKLNAEGRSATQNDTCVVVGYAVRDVNQRLGAATLSVDSVTSNSVTLAWAPPTNRANIRIGSYNVYRYIADSSNPYYYLGSVDASAALRYTDTDCAPETKYTYVVQAVAKSNAKTGIMSNKASALTNPLTDPTVTGPSSLSVITGSPARFSVNVRSSSSKPIQYQWQTCATGQTTWSVIKGANSSILSLGPVSVSSDGNRYRCVVTQLVGLQVKTVISQPATLTVGKADTVTTLTAPKSDPGNSSTGSAVTVSANVADMLGSTAVPDSQVVFTITPLDGRAASTASATTDATGAASTSWTPSVAGYYTIAAEYDGTADRNASNSATLTYYAYALGERLAISADKATLPYGDSIAFTASLITDSLEDGVLVSKTIPITGDLAWSLTFGTGATAVDLSSSLTFPDSTDPTHASFPPPSAGDYTVTATLTDESAGTLADERAFTVSKVPVAVTATADPARVYVGEDAALGHTLTGLIEGESEQTDYPGLFETLVDGAVGPVSGLAAGSYVLTANYSATADAGVKTLFVSRYEPTFTTGTLDVARETCAAPTFTPEAGTYVSTQEVSLACATDGASIRYTTDGTTPSATTGTLYTGTPITVSESMTINAIAYVAGMNDSAVSSAAYVIATPVYKLGLSADGSSLAPLVYGYTLDNMMTCTLSNSGNMAQTGLLDRMTLSDGTRFALSWDPTFDGTLAPGATTVLTVSTAKGLDAGTYDAKIIVAGDAETAETSLAFTQVVEKAPQAAPSLATVNASTNASADGRIVGLNPSSSYQYRPSGESDWTALVPGSFRISGLVPGAYDVRLAGDANHLDGEAATVTVGANQVLVWTRLGGMDRYATMGLISETGFADDSCDTVIVAKGTDFPDALTASSLSGLIGCPLLLTNPNELSPACASQIIRLGATHVIVIGGEDSVVPSVVDSIQALDASIEIERVGGANRYETSRLVYEKGLSLIEEPGSTYPDWSTTAIITTGADFPDALSIAPYAYAENAPVFLVDSSGKLSDETLALIRNGSFTRALLLGNTNRVSDEVTTQLGEGVTCIRLGGANRYETSTIIANWLCGEGFTCDGMAVTTGTKFPDALAAGSLCGLTHSTLLLVDDSETGRFGLGGLIEPRADTIGHGYILGDTPSVSEDMAQRLEAAVE